MINQIALVSPAFARRGLGSGHISTIVVGLFFCFLASPVYGAATSAAQAKAVVEGWLKADTKPLGTALGNQINGVVTCNGADGIANYYVVSLKPAGYVVVPADDDIEPIISFSPTGSYIPSSANPMGALICRDLAGRMVAIRKTAAAPKVRAVVGPEPVEKSLARRKWESLTAIVQNAATPRGINSVSDIRIAPLLQSQWSQAGAAEQQAYPCYNYFTPNHYVCGCVATAMAQLMRYHQYPTTAVGQPQFTIKVDGTPQLWQLDGGDGAGGPYNWSLMPLVPSISTSDAQRQAIGRLCEDAGLSVNMNYSSQGSGTFPTSQSLKSTFHYSNAVLGGTLQSQIPVSALQTMINTNLDAKLPVLLSIYGSLNGQPEGHEIVCDGYGYNSGTLYHHLNLGWSGNSDAWYSLPTIDTQQITFNAVYGCVYNVFKSGSGEIITGRVVDASSGHPISGATVSATGTSITQTTDSQGIYALIGLVSNRSYTVSATMPNLNFTTTTVNVGMSSDRNSYTGNVWGANLTTAAAPPPPTQKPIITSATAAYGTTNQSFSYQILASNNPTSFNATGLPQGLSVNTSNGAISGTPTVAGTTNCTVTATNSAGTGSASLTISIASSAKPVITSALTANGSVGQVFNYQITATNAPNSFSATGLPGGLSVNTGTGLISGTPTTSGTSSISISATNANGSGSAILTLNVASSGEPVITSSLTVLGIVGETFSYQIAASNNPSSFNAVGLPAGLTFSTTTGLISGSPAVVGLTNVTITASNGNGTATGTLVMNIVSPGKPVITSVSDAYGWVGQSFNYQITATGNPTSFTATGLPDGLSVNQANGLITGTPTTVGSTTVSLSATNGDGTGNASLVTNIVAGSGTINTVAGNGKGGTSGNGGPATNAAVKYPIRLAVDGNANLYISSMNYNVRTGAYNSSALRVVDGITGKIAILKSASKFLGRAKIHGFAIDSENRCYLTNWKDHSVWSLDLNTGIGTKIAGNGKQGNSGDGGPAIQASLSWPEGIAVDKFGNVFVSCFDIQGNGVVKKIQANDPLSGTGPGNASLPVIRTIAGGGAGGDGPATSASLAVPLALAVDSAGGLLILESHKSPAWGKIRRVDLTTGTISTVVSRDYVIYGMTLDGFGNIFFSSSGTVFRVDATGAATTPVVAIGGNPGYSGDGGLAASAQINYPWGLASDAWGNLFVADTSNNRVRKVSNSAKALITSTLTATGTVGVPFSYIVTGSGTPPFLIQAAPLPPGCTLIGTTITGTPTQAGATNVVLTLRNGSGVDSKTLVLTVNAQGQ